MRKKRPKYLLVLIWSFRSEVIKQEIDFLKKGGKLIFHLPMLHIIDKQNLNLKSAFQIIVLIQLVKIYPKNTYRN